MTPFGEVSSKRLSAPGKAEPLLWDFKQTLAMWHGTGNDRQRLKVEFVEDLASFANARGGILVISVTDRREIVGVIGSIRDLENFLKSASDAVSKHRDYPRPIVSFNQVVIPVQGVDKTCLIIVVAQTCEAVGVDDGNRHYTCPIRHETGLSRMSEF